MTTATGGRMPSHRTFLRALVLPLAIAGSAAAAQPSDGGDYKDTVEQQKPKGPTMLGIEMSPNPQHVLEREHLSPDQGVYVQSVFNNTAASSMGVKSGD